MSSLPPSLPALHRLPPIPPAHPSPCRSFSFLRLLPFPPFPREVQNIFKGKQIEKGIAFPTCVAANR